MGTKLDYNMLTKTPITLHTCIFSMRYRVSQSKLEVFKQTVHKMIHFIIQGDPKQKVIFETDHTWPKNDFLGAN